MNAHLYRIYPLLVAVSVTFGACRQDRSASVDHEPPTLGTRTLASVRWDTAWVRGGTETDTVVLFPFAITADSEQVYVLDAAAKRVVALSASDGSLAWTAGRAGGGPNEFREPTALALMPTGELAIADAANARVALLSRSGSFVGHIALQRVSHVQSMCALRDESLLLTTMELDQPVLRLARSGVITARYDLPWPDSQHLPPLTRAAVLARTGDGVGCVAALSYGRGFARFDGRKFEAPRPYIEWFDLPKVEVSESTESGTQVRRERMLERRIAAYDVAVDGNVLAVAFEGRTENARRLLDFYDVQTGGYLHSYLLPWPAIGMARAGSSYVLLGAGQGNVVTLQPHTARIQQ